jgi:hypothetical protein
MFRSFGILKGEGIAKAKAKAEAEAKAEVVMIMTPVKTFYNSLFMLRWCRMVMKASYQKRIVQQSMILPFMTHGTYHEHETPIKCLDTRETNVRENFVGLLLKEGDQQQDLANHGQNGQRMQDRKRIRKQFRHYLAFGLEKKDMTTASPFQESKERGQDEKEIKELTFQIRFHGKAM